MSEGITWDDVQATYRKLSEEWSTRSLSCPEDLILPDVRPTEQTLKNVERQRRVIR